MGYAIFPYFNTQAVDDPEPVALAEPVVEETEPEEPALPTSISLEHLTDKEKSDMMLGLLETNKEEVEPMDEPMPETAAAAEESESDGENDEEELTEVAVEPRAFPVVATALHPASGDVKVIETAEGTVIRFEDFETINGPNLHLYLAKDLDATEFVDLGPIRGTEGNINYLVPEGVDVSEYQYIMHWCVPFGVLFNYAEIG